MGVAACPWGFHCLVAELCDEEVLLELLLLLGFYFNLVETVAKHTDDFRL